MAKPRLYVECPLEQGSNITIEGDAHHYLARVMRLKFGDVIEVFNGSSDGFNAKICATDKRATIVELISIETPFRLPPPLTLAFAPIKKARTDFIVEKACELGVRSIMPVITDYTNAERINVERLSRHTIEAAEQCGGTYVPRLSEPKSFQDFLKFDNGQIIFCDEMAENGEGAQALMSCKSETWTIIIGPEGGFSPNERASLLSAGALRISLGPRILRADTAAVSAITLWQNIHGDWK